MRIKTLASGLALLAAAGLTAGCGGPATPVSPPLVQELVTPAAPGSGQPDLSLGADGRLYLSWIEPAQDEAHRLRFALWQGDGWGEARTIASGSDWFVNWADFPSMTALADGTLAAHWRVMNGASTYAYDVVVALSRDAGRNWSEPLRPHRDGSATEHGFVSLLPGADRFLLVWLDGRRTAEDEPGPMTLRAAWLGVDGALSGERLIDEQVCDCCSTDAALGPDGAIVLAYRDRSAGEIRDVYLSRLDGDDWSTGRAVHDDGWEIGGCPVNGPVLAAGAGRLGCAWFTMGADERPRVQVAFSTDPSSGFGDPIEIDDGQPIGRVDLVALEDGAMLASWVERQGETAVVRVRRVDPAGQPSAALTAIATSVSRSSGFPRLARLDDRLFIAWTAIEGETTRVRTGLLTPPR